MNAPPLPRSRLSRAAVLDSLAARPRVCKYRSEHAAQEFQGVAAEDLVDAGRREAAGGQQAGQVVELVVTGQDRTVVSVQVGTEGHVVRAGRLGEPEDLGAEVGEGAVGDAAGPGADQVRLGYGATAWTSQTAASRCTPSASANGVSAARTDASGRDRKSVV